MPSFASGLGQSAVAAGILGSADFAGGLAARRRGALPVAAVSQLIELVAISAFVVLVRPSPPAPVSLLIGACAGIAGAVGITALYRGLSVGNMGIVAALSGVGSVAIPVVAAAMFLGAAPTAIQFVGIGFALAASISASAFPGDTGSARGTVFGLIAAVGFGTYLLLLNAGIAHGVWALVASRASAALALGGAAVARGGGVDRATLPLVGAAALMDLAGNVLVVTALASLPVGLVAAVAGTYPVATAVLARVVLRQHPRLRGYASIGLALIGVILIGQR